MFGCVIRLNAGEPDLADAGGIAARRLDIQYDKPKMAIGITADMLTVWAKSGDHILICQAL
jgi:hypothetical protein